jgi:opacity protein-like surface antigen
MKKTLLALSALTVAAFAQNSNAADMYANQYSGQYGMAPQQYAPQQYAANPYPPQQNPYPNGNPYAQAPQQYAPPPQAYNNIQPRSGRDFSYFPFWYLGINVGDTFGGADKWKRGAARGSLDNNSAISYSAAIGYKPSNFRYEVELGYTDRDIDSGTSSGSIKAGKLMANALYDIPTNWGVSPFLGAGIGAVHADISPTNPATADGASTRFGYQLIAGASINDVFPQVDASLAYKYLDAPGEFKEDGAKFEYSSHTVEAGMRYRF